MERSLEEVGEQEVLGEDSWGVWLIAEVGIYKNAIHTLSESVC